ncbi:MAG: CHAT domain-containing protein [Coleofasciculaceae cyanobacterium]
MLNKIINYLLFNWLKNNNKKKIKIPKTKLLTFRRRITINTFCFLLVFSFCLTQSFAWLTNESKSLVAAQTSAETPVNQASTLMSQARELYKTGQLSEAIEVLKQAAQAFAAQRDNLGQSQALAQAFDLQGQLQLAQGKSELAAASFSEAVTIYQQIDDETGLIKSQLNQVEALRTSGQFRRALDILEQVNKDLQDQPDSLLKAIGLRSFGITQRLVGDLEKAQDYTLESLGIAQELQSPQDIGSAYLALGNIAKDKANISLVKGTINFEQSVDATDSEEKIQEQGYQEITLEAIDNYRDAAEIAPMVNTKIEAKLNQLSVVLETEEFLQQGKQKLLKKISPEFEEEIQQRVAQLPQELETLRDYITQLPPSRTSINTRLNWARTVMKRDDRANFTAAEIAEQLIIAIEQARSFQDYRAESYALGQLGELRQQEGQLEQAREDTKKALLLAQSINASEIAYRWQWQLGEILKAQGNPQEAITAYSAAVNNLESLRGDLVTMNRDVQFSFQESVEPVYRQLVGLLLQSKQEGTGEVNLKQARKVIESLQQAELVNFFREDCLTAESIEIDDIDKKAAVIYPIVLEESLEVVVSLPGGDLEHHTIPIAQTEVEKVFSDLRRAVAPSSESNRTPTGSLTEDTSRARPQPRPGSNPYYIKMAQTVYDWLIKPSEQQIGSSGVETLVFVLDAPLLNLPMSVLHDGNKFLVQKYAIAQTPGLQLLDPQPLAEGELTALKAGLSEATDGFSALPNVEKELEKISDQIPGELILNQDFTREAIQNAINSTPFPVVHLATHGQFSSEVENTFILTANGRLNVYELKEMLQSREEGGKDAIELLVLSACETATGDQRAALGLAGVAVNAGARSTLATLWTVDDAGTADLMISFYDKLKANKISKAQALRLAQMEFIENSDQYQDPYYWAPFVLVGNWL